MSPSRIAQKISGFISAASVGLVLINSFNTIPLPAHADAPTSQYYLYVNTDGYDGSTDYTGCNLINTSVYPSYPPDLSVYTDSSCNLGEAINLVNDLGSDSNFVFYHDTDITIRIADDPSPLHIDHNLPAITFPGILYIDGQQGSSSAPRKTVIQDTSSTETAIDHFFRINPRVTAFYTQSISITNFAFLGLKKNTAAAITTDDPSTTLTIDSNHVASNFEGGFITDITIANNYFGTTDGFSINNNNHLSGAIKLSLYPTSVLVAPPATYSAKPHVNIHDNNIYNTTSPITINSGTVGDIVDPTAYSCKNNVELEEHSAITNNSIGQAINGNINQGDSLNGTGWLGNAIDICHLRGLTIRGNTITNSNKNIVLMALAFNSAIALRNSAATIQDNTIGFSTVGSSSADQLSIIGNGITVEKDYSTATRSFITGNKIHNIRRPGSPALCTEHSSRYNPLSTTSTICGGTGIMIEGSSNNWVYKNTIGSANMPNQGYGISIEGSITHDEISGEPTFNTSFSNKITGNIISYNNGDGIHIGNITPSETVTIDLDCRIDSEKRNNCENAISNNRIFRNGASTTSNSGGIGIDLKSRTDTEQKNTSSSTDSTTGSNNDTDISTTAGNGGNGLQLAPSLYGIGGSTAHHSTSSEINGYLPAGYPTGKYWIEVFQVQCPATGENDVSTITTATMNCDTDSISSSEQNLHHSFGQGSNFLCGTEVNKTSNTVLDWSCRPEQFGQHIDSGLITATATEILTPYTQRSYSNLEASLQAADTIVPISTTILGIPTIRYSCELIQTYLSNVTPCNGASGTTGAGLSELGNLYIANFLGNSSEFSQNIFIASATVNMTKTVTTCTTSNPTSCNSTYAENTTAPQDSYVDFRITITNPSSNTSNTNVQLTDPLPTGLGIVADSCSYQVNADISTGTPARNDSHNSNCTYINPLQIDINDLQPGKSAVIYFMGHVLNDASGTIQNTATTTISGVESGHANASISITPNGTATTSILTLQKSISTPDHVGNPLNGTVTSSSLTQTINYTIVATATGYTNSTIGSLQLQDNFPHATISHFYDENSCVATVIIGSNAPSTIPCNNRSTINTTGETPLTLLTGTDILSTVDGVTIAPNDTIEIDLTYTATVPANVLTSGADDIPINSTAIWSESSTLPEARHTSSTSLIIQAINSGTNNIPTITKLVRACNNSTVTSCSGNTFSSSITNLTAGANVEYRIDISNPSTSTVAVSLADTQPTNLTFVRDSNACQIFHDVSTITDLNSARANGGSTCVFTNNQLQTALSIGPGHHTYVYILATSNSNFRGTITNQAQLTAGCNRNCLSQASITIANSPTPSSTATPTTSNITITKHADNNVTNNDHSNEKIYKPGETVNYTINLLNSSTSTITGINLRDVINDQITNITGDNLASGINQTHSSNTTTFSNISAAAGTTPTTIQYHGTITSRSNFNLDQFNLDKNTDLEKDDDFYASRDTDIVEDEVVSNNNNSHHRAENLLGAPDGKFVSLGQDGSITLDLGDKVIVNGSGDDFALLQINSNADDTDQNDEALDVEVSQNGTTFKRLNASDDDYHYDINKAHLSWVKYLRLTDSSTTTTPKAPGVDLDAVCLFNIGVRLGNQATITNTNAFANENITVDVTNTFAHKLSKDSCTEESTNIIPALVSPPALVAPPVNPTPAAAKPNPLPKPKNLPKTGTTDTLLLLVAISSGLSWLVLKIKKQR